MTTGTDISSCCMCVIVPTHDIHMVLRTGKSCWLTGTFLCGRCMFTPYLCGFPATDQRHAPQVTWQLFISGRCECVQNKCLSKCAIPMIDWRPVQCVFHLSPDVRWDRFLTPTVLYRISRYRRWIDLGLN